MIERLTRPHPDVRDSIDQKIARFIATFHLITLPFGPMALVVKSYTAPDVTMTPLWAFFTALSGFCNYLVARTRWFNVSVIAQVVLSFLAVYYTAYTIPQRQSLHFVFLVPLLLAAVLMSFRAVIVTSVCVLLGLGSLVLFHDDIYHPSLLGSFWMMSIFALLIIFLRYHRNMVEEIRIDQVHREKKKYMAVVDAVFDGTATINGGVLQDVSLGFARLFNMQPEQVNGQAATTFFSEDTLQGFKSSSILNKQMRTSEGDVRYFQMAMEAGASSGTIALRDITSEQEQQARRLMSDRLTASGALAAGIAHELNSPLMIAMNQMHLANKEMLEGDEHPLQQRVRSTAEALDRVTAILNDLKWFVQEQGERAHDVNQVIENTIRLAKHRIRHKATITMDLHDVFSLNLTESALSQILINLLFNAAEAKRDISETCQIAIRSRITPQNTVEIRVEDDGVGIPVDARIRIFDPFYTTRSDGTGLGLSICHRLVVDAGGQIFVEAIEPNGTAFVLTFPRANDSLEVLKTSASKEEGVLSILVMDDEIELLSIIEEMLEPHRCVCVSELNQALDAIEMHDFDMALCDVMMPRAGAIELHDILSKQSKPLAEKIIFITGGIVDTTVRSALSQIDQPILFKPFGRQGLMDAISTMMGEKAIAK